MNFFRKLRQRFRLKSFERGDYTSTDERPVENLDAGAAAGGSAPGYPPGYVKDYYDDRPRK